MAEEIKVWGDGTKGLWSAGKTVDVSDGYIEVPPGDPFVTRKIKQLAGVVYVRMIKRKRLGLSVVVGLLAPEGVVREAISEAERTKQERSKKTARSQDYRKRREEKKQGGLIERIKDMFPGMPEGEAEGIVSHAFEVGSGRVGRTTKVADDTKIELAVRGYPANNALFSR